MEEMKLKPILTMWLLVTEFGADPEKGVAPTKQLSLHRHRTHAFDELADELVEVKPDDPRLQDNVLQPLRPADTWEQSDVPMKVEYDLAMNAYEAHLTAIAITLGVRHEVYPMGVPSELTLLAKDAVSRLRATIDGVLAAVKVADARARHLRPKLEEAVCQLQPVETMMLLGECLALVDAVLLGVRPSPELPRELMTMITAEATGHVVETKE